MLSDVKRGTVDSRLKFFIDLKNYKGSFCNTTSKFLRLGKQKSRKERRKEERQLVKLRRKAFSEHKPVRLFF